MFFFVLHLHFFILQTFYIQFCWIWGKYMNCHLCAKHRVQHISLKVSFNPEDLDYLLQLFFIRVGAKIRTEVHQEQDYTISFLLMFSCLNADTLIVHKRDHINLVSYLLSIYPSIHSPNSFSCRILWGDAGVSQSQTKAGKHPVHHRAMWGRSSQALLEILLDSANTTTQSHCLIVNKHDQIK